MTRYPNFRHDFKVFLILTTFSIGPVSAQSPATFFDSDSSVIDYTATNSRPIVTCESLQSLSNYNYSITSARIVEATEDIPEHCRVYGHIQPEIKFGVHLPTQWNSRFYMQGNGGFAGNAPDIPFTLERAMQAVSHGFASASTDTGHDSRVEPAGTFAHNNTAKEIDYAFRAVHLTAETAKSIVASYYGKAQDYSYWNGCSTGGRQGLMSAQRFPADFDGILAAAPVLDFTGTMLGYVWNHQALSKAPLTEAKVAALGEIIYDRCDKTDGLVDGLIDDPRQCNFEPSRDLPKCSDSQSSDQNCFSSGEIDTLQAIYGGPSVNGQQLFPGQPIGAERNGGWNRWIASDQNPTIGNLFANTFFKYLAFTPDEPEFELGGFDFSSDPERIEISEVLDSTNPDLSAFQNRGGKLITYFGWADPALNPLMGINYYDDVRALLGETATRDFYRLFMVPGMFHCSGGVGTDWFDALTPLINWVEAGIAPDSINASRIENGATTRTRPLCPYPQTAKYNGSGSIDDAANFSCVAP